MKSLVLTIWEACLESSKKRRGLRWGKGLVLLLFLFTIILPAVSASPAKGHRYNSQFTLPDEAWRALLASPSEAGTLTTFAGMTRITTRQGYKLPGWQRLLFLPQGATVQLIARGEDQQQLKGWPSPIAVPSAAASHAVLAQTPWAVVEDVGYLRGYHLGRLVVQPAYWNAGKRTWQVARRVEVSLCVRGREGTSATDVWGRTLSHYLLNGGGVTVPNDRGPWPNDLRQLQINHWAQQPGSLRLTIDHTGLYQLTGSDLQAAGWDIGTINPARVQLWHGDQQIAIWGMNQQDGRLDAGDAFRFYAHPQPSRYQAADVYWLVVGDKNGLRMGTRDVEPNEGTTVDSARQTFTWEEKKIYDSQWPGPDGDHWFAVDLRSLEFPPYPAQTFTFNLPDLAAWKHRQTLEVWFTGYTDSPHDLQVTLNGYDLEDESWTGQQDAHFSVALPANTLHREGNVLRLRSADRGNPPDGVYFDRFSVGYRAVLQAHKNRLTWQSNAGKRYFQIHGVSAPVCLWDVTSPEASQLLLHGYWDAKVKQFRFTDETMQATIYELWPCSEYQKPLSVVLDTPSHLAEASNQADYLMIAPRRFWSTLLPLWQWRSACGLRVQMVDLQDVYDEFSFGRVDPQALRFFLATAYHLWQAPVLQYALLVGDGSYDYRDYYGWHPSNILPPYLADVDPWLGETASDNQLAAVSGDDNLPDFFLGRLPVANESELHTVVAKIIRYEANPDPAWWQRRITFVADNFRDAAGNEDRAGDFVAHVELSAGEQIPLAFAVQRLYYDPWPPTSSLPGHVANVDRFREDVHGVWNQGSFIINYVGHSSYWQWMEENAFHLNDIPALHNGDRLPFLLAMTCFTGFFQHPEHPAIDGALLTHQGGGTVGSWSSTGLALASGHRFLQQGFYQALFNEGTRTIGPLTLAGELNLLSKTDQYSFLIDTYLVLGDPALQLPNVLRLSTSFLPTVTLAPYH